MLRNEENSRRIALLAFGLIKGVVYTVIFWSLTKNHHTNAMLIAPVILTAVTMSILTLTYRDNKNLRLYPIAFVVGLVFALLTLWVASFIPESRDLYRGDGMRIASLCISTVVAFYILLPYIQTYYESKRLSFPYEALFRYSWNNFFIIALAGLFTAIFQGLTTLWWALFSIVGVDIFKSIFLTTEFNLLVLPVAFGLGVAILRERDKIIITLRSILFSLSKVLLPMVTLIALLFILTLPLTGLDPLWSTGKTSPIILTLLSLIILFLNAVFQMGSEEPPYPKWLRRPIEVMILTMPIYTAIALYSTFIRIGDYGLSPMRVYAVLIEIMIMLYAIGYSISVLRGGEVWMNGIKKINVFVSLIIVGTIILLHTPILDPLKLSANNQYNRLISGKVSAEDFDFAALRFKFGKVGYDKLNLLKDIEGHAEATEIKEAVEDALTLDYYNRKRSKTKLVKAEDIMILTPSGELPKNIFDSFKKNLGVWRMNSCAKDKDCIVFNLNIDNDIEEEYLFVTSGKYYSIYIYDDEICCKKNYSSTRDGLRPTREELITAIKESQIDTIDAKYKDILVGKTVLTIR